jgi:hypothetical protein
VSDPDMMIVHVVTPRAVEEPTVEAAATVVAAPGATAEPEVIKKGKTEKEGEAPAKEGAKK